MTDAPERIWADGDETGLDGFCDWLWVRGSWNRSKEGVGEVEYIRADLVAALEAENRRLREALDPDNLAQIIRAVDGGNRLGAGALAEEISAALRSTREDSPSG